MPGPSLSATPVAAESRAWSAAPTPWSGPSQMTELATSVWQLEGGNYVVLSPFWDNGLATDAGAVTFGNAGSGGISGEVNFLNSAIGQTSNANLQRFVVDDVNGNFFAAFVNDGGGRVRVGSQAFGFLIDTTIPAGGLVVDTIADEFDGLYSSGDLSLREAIFLANANAGANTITFHALFDTQQTIALVSQLPTISDDLTITGPGQTLLTLDAGNGTDNLPGTADGFRIFSIDDGDSQNQIDVEISGMTLTGGDVSSGDLGGDGGAILTVEDLTVINTTISDNAAESGGGMQVLFGTTNITSSTISSNSATNYRGGGIFILFGTANITSSEISGNSSQFGGGIYNLLGTANISSSTISGNSVSGSGRGGGIFNEYGTTDITGSTISGNSSIVGGGIYINNGTANITGSTISGNSSVYSGGIRNNATATVTNSTISGNSATQLGGGITNLGTAILNNTIVANSISGGDIFTNATLTGSYSLIEDGSGGPGLLNTISGDPLLGPLADNGGATLTHALLAGSLAINAGDPAVTFNPTEFDQRGSGFPRVELGSIDLGAVEFGDASIPVQGLVVDTTSDVLDGIYSVGNCCSAKRSPWPTPTREQTQSHSTLACPDSRSCWAVQNW